MMTIGHTHPHAAAMRPAPYGHGTILAGAADEARQSTQGRRMIREGVMALGKDSIYNLTGLVRTFPLQPQDLEPLENQFTYHSSLLREAVTVGSSRMLFTPRGFIGEGISMVSRISVGTSAARGTA
jgi:hypothetical protein